MVYFVYLVELVYLVPLVYLICVVWSAMKTGLARGGMRYLVDLVFLIYLFNIIPGS